MKIKNILIAAVSTIAPLLTLLPPVTAPATAQSRSLCSANIRGQQEGSQVNMRSGPGTDFNSPAFVLVGQRVTLLTNDPRDSRSPINPIIRKDNQDMNWYLVEYVPSETRGWIRADFIGSINCR
jgi:hypothetical protein